MYELEEEPSALRAVTLDFGIIELREDNILTFEPYHDVETVTLGQLQKMLDSLLDMTDGIPRPFYSNNSRMKSLGFAERQFIGKNIHRFATASAICENSSVIRFISHTIIDIFKPKIPLQMFETKDAAIEWLRSTQE